MRVLITDKDHRHYKRTGEIVAQAGETFSVRIPNKDGTIQTTVREGDFQRISENGAG